MTLTFVIFSASSVSLVARISTSLSFSFMLVTVPNPKLLFFSRRYADVDPAPSWPHKTIESRFLLLLPPNAVFLFDPKPPFKITLAAIKCARTSENRTKKSSRRRMRASETSEAS